MGADYRQQQEAQEHQQWLESAQSDGLIFCPYCYKQLEHRGIVCCHEVHGGTIEEIGKENFI